MFNPTPDNSSIKDDRSNSTLYLIIFAIEPAVCALFFGIVISYAKSHVNGFIFNKNSINGIITSTGKEIYSSKVILTTGTFLNGMIHIGNKITPAGRYNEK